MSWTSSWPRFWDCRKYRFQTNKILPSRYYDCMDEEKRYVLDKGEPTKENLRKALEKEGQRGIAQKL